MNHPRSSTNHPTEEELIAFQMCEATQGSVAAAERRISEHLELCPPCAQAAEEIASTLRIFSADAVPRPDLDQAWQRLRLSLPPVQPVRRHWINRTADRWLRLSVPALAMLLLATFLTTRVHTPAHVLLAPGPLSDQPRDPQTASSIANHLEDAERLLTTISHESGPLDASTQAQARKLSLQNAVYVRQARASGDLPEASVLEDLGRTLTTLNHEQDGGKGWHLRMELNANGLLLDIRILQQNDAQPDTAGTPRQP